MLTVDFSLFPIIPGECFLDVGCGEGRHMVQACKTDKSICVAGDICTQNLIRTRKKILFHQKFNEIICHDFSFANMDITALPFKNETFDKIVCSEVLEHIPDDNKAILELFRILKPGGILAISVPSFLPEKLCWLLSRSYANTKGGHIRIYTKKTLMKKCILQGFRPVKSNKAHSLHSPYWWLKCVIGLDNEKAFPVVLLHRFLIWDMMKKPVWTRWIDKLLSPLLGKSLVIYLVK